MALRCATTNAGKLREFRLAALHFGYPQVEIAALDNLASVAPPAEEGESFEENAIEKALYYSVFTDEPVFADDSGLEVDALGGAPGIYSARFAGAKATDAMNNALLLERLQGQPDRTARFVCAIALAQNGKLLGTYRGIVQGTILEAARGTGGFGYDPLFYYEPFDCTFAEIAADLKLGVSHRGNALCKMLEAYATAL